MLKSCNDGGNSYHRAESVRKNLILSIKTASLFVYSVIMIVMNAMIKKDLMNFTVDKTNINHFLKELLLYPKFHFEDSSTLL